MEGDGGVIIDLVTKTNKFVIDQISFFNRGCQVSSPTDSKTHLVLVTCYTTWTGTVLGTCINLL